MAVKACGGRLAGQREEKPGGPVVGGRGGWRSCGSPKSPWDVAFLGGVGSHCTRLKRGIRELALCSRGPCGPSLQREAAEKDTGAGGRPVVPVRDDGGLDRAQAWSGCESPRACAGTIFAFSRL